MTEIIISASILALIAVFASMKIDKQYSVFYIFSFIASIVIGITISKLSIPSAGGVALAVVQGIVIYILSKNTVYATYMTYAVYTTFYFGDLFAGIVYVVFMKIKLMQYFSSIQGVVVFGIVTIIFSIPVIFLLRLITSKKLRFKEIEISNKAKIVMYTFTPAALFVHAFLANRTRNSGIQEEILKQSLLLNSASVVIFMFGIYCILSTCIKKDIKRGKELENIASDSTKEELDEMIKIYQKYKENKK